MSDFGFDAYALDGADTAAQPHPLEIARDLIASGRSRAALEMLSEHHEALADDPEYLMLCAEAWLAEGDELRAQQALLGAARLAPEDPRPLVWLGELMLERGEQEKAERILAKARALQGRPSWTAASGPGADLETEDDLIAFAERQERRAQGSLNPRYVLLVVVGLAVLVLIVGGIAFITSPHKAASPSEGSAPDSDPAADTALPSAGSVPDTSLPPRDSAADAVTEQQAVSPAVDEEPSVMDVAEAASPAVPLPPAELPPPRAKAAKPKAKAPPRKASSSARESASEEPTTRGPSADVVQAELASMNPKQLTARADALYQEGHTGIAASYYRRALELDPDYAPALVGVGQGILRAKKYPEAMRNATRALQLARGVDARPGLEAEAIYQMGRVHYERGERDAARRLFRQSISLPGTPSEAWFYLGEALSSDNSPAAREAYEQYLVLVPKGHLADRARRAIQ